MLFLLETHTTSFTSVTKSHVYKPRSSCGFRRKGATLKFYSWQPLQKRFEIPSGTVAQVCTHKMLWISSGGQRSDSVSPWRLRRRYQRPSDHPKFIMESQVALIDRSLLWWRPLLWRRGHNSQSHPVAQEERPRSRSTRRGGNFNTLWWRLPRVRFVLCGSLLETAQRGKALKFVSLWCQT